MHSRTLGHDMQLATDMKFHEECKNFNEMNESDLAALADDIYENGLREAIWTYQDEIIDGRNRYKACKMVGVEPTFREWCGEGSLVSFVYSLNLFRRHLTAGQRAAKAVDLKKSLEKEIADEDNRSRPRSLGNNANTRPSKPRDARKEAAALVGVSEGYVASAERIAKASPEVAAEVMAGTKTIPQARKELGLTPPKPSGKCRLNGVMVDDPPDIAKQRASGQIPKNAVVDIELPEDPTTLAEVTEEREEQAAIADDMGDEDWLLTLPARASLQGSRLASFDGNAILYRRLEQHVKTLAYHATRAFSKQPKEREGPYYWRVNSFLKFDHPRKWLVCPSTQDGGCGGTGTVLIYGECPKCHARGYWINK